MKERFVRWVLSARVPISLIVIVLMIPTLYFATRVSMDFDVERYFPEGDRDMATFLEFKKKFRAPDGAVSLFWWEKNGVTPGTLVEMERVATIFRREGLGDIYWVKRAMEEYGTKSLERFIREQGKNRFLEGIIWNRQKNVFVITAHLPRSMNTDAGRKRLEGRLDTLLRRFRHSGRTLILTGEPIIRSKYLKLMARDQVVLLGGGVLITFFLMYLFLGSVVQSLMTLVAVIPSYCMVLALLAITGRPITAIMSMVPLILLVVGLSDTIHILMPFRERMRLSPSLGVHKKEGMIVNTFGEIMGSCFFTSLTTSLGFLSLSLARIEVVTDFSIATSLGIMLTFVFSMILFPLILRYAPAPRQLVPGRPGFFSFFSTFSVIRSLIIVSLMALVSLIFYFPARQVTMESHILNDLRRGAPLLKDLNHVQGAGFGVFQVNLYLRGDHRGIDPRLFVFNEKIEAFSRKFPFITKVLSLNSFVEEGFRRRGLAFSPSMAGSLGAAHLKQQVDSWAQQEKSLRSVYHPSTGSTQVMITIKDVGSKKLEPFIRKLQAFAQKQGKAFSPKVTGTAYLSGRTYERLMAGFLLSLAAVGILIFIILLLAGRSLPLAIIALFPNLFPLLALLGVVGFFSYPLTPASLLVFTVALSLVVDDTVHLLTHLALRRSQYSRVEDLFRKVFSVSGKAVILTSLVIAAGFSVMMLSTFQTIFDMGFLIVIAMFFALVGDLLLLPALYYLAHRLNIL
ncbi:MMPL family transporter [Myxococcota bacterium]|nr:MMPL family transporter [Myxococcota bacterium]